MFFFICRCVSLPFHYLHAYGGLRFLLSALHSFKALYGISPFLKFRVLSIFLRRSQYTGCDDPVSKESPPSLFSTMLWCCPKSRNGPSVMELLSSFSDWLAFMCGRSHICFVLLMIVSSIDAAFVVWSCDAMGTVFFFFFKLILFESKPHIFRSRLICCWAVIMGIGLRPWTSYSPFLNEMQSLWNKKNYLPIFTQRNLIIIFFSQMKWLSLKNKIY